MRRDNFVIDYQAPYSNGFTEANRQGLHAMTEVVEVTRRTAPSLGGLTVRLNTDYLERYRKDLHQNVALTTRCSTRGKVAVMLRGRYV